MSMLNRAQFDAEMEDEIRFHIETRAEELEERGVPAKAALEQARREFGSRALAMEDSRRAWQIPWLEDFWRDLLYAARGWKRNPGFTAVAVLSLALGVGANCAMFIVVDAMLLRPLPLTARRRSSAFITRRWTVERRGSPRRNMPTCAITAKVSRD